MRLPLLLTSLLDAQNAKRNKRQARICLRMQGDSIVLKTDTRTLETPGITP